MFSRGWELNLGWRVQSTMIVQSSGFQIIRAAHTSFRRDPPSLQPAKLYFSNTLRLHAFLKVYLKSMCLLQYTWIVQLDKFCSICVELYLIPSMPYCIRVIFFSHLYADIQEIKFYWPHSITVQSPFFSFKQSFGEKCSFRLIPYHHIFEINRYKTLQLFFYSSIM